MGAKTAGRRRLVTKGGPLAALALVLLAPPAMAREYAAFKVIVHGAQSGGAIRRAQLQGIFLKKVTEWGDGTPIRPVDQSSRFRVRAAFSLNVLDLPLSAIQAYWQREMVVNRERPPLVMGSDEEVTAFVAATPGAIGYVSTGAAFDDTVKVLKIVD